MAKPRSEDFHLQPVGCHTKADPGGAPSCGSTFILLLGKTTKGGINVPPTEAHTTKVERTPLSADVSVPTCRRPFRAKTLDDFD